MSNKHYLLHGATNFGSSNYGDFLYGEIIYNFLRERGNHVQFAEPSDYFKKYLQEYPVKDQMPLKEADGVIYVPGGYFGEGHQARFRDNLVQFYRFMPVGIQASYQKKPIIVLGIGAGPNHNLLMNFGIKRICNHADSVTVRDHESFEAIKKLCPKANVIETFDLIIASDLMTKDTSFQLEMLRSIKESGKKILLVHYNHSKEALKKFATAAKHFTQKNTDYHVVVTSDSILPYEEEYFTEFKSIFKDEATHFIYDDPHEMTGLLQLVDVVLTCKLHVGVVACTFNKSVLAFACHPEKTARFYEEIGEKGRCQSLFVATSEQIAEALTRYHEQDIQISKAQIKKAAETMTYLERFIGETYE